MSTSPSQCLVLACGNTLRSDDGVGPWLADWVEERFAAEPAVRVISRQQWTPDLAADVALARSVVFVDCALGSSPGEVRMVAVTPASATGSLATHHVGAAELLAVGQELYSSLPQESWQLTIGAGSTEMGETFSTAVESALPEACNLLETAVQRTLVSGQPNQRA